MQIVIDIPDSVYENIINGTIETDGYFKANLRECFKNGTPLPKGHGDLIDRNDLLEYTDINRSAYTPTINRYDIITTPTIIEGSDKDEDRS